MWTRLLLAAVLGLGLPEAAMAQAPSSDAAAPPTATARNPVLGDPGVVNTPKPRSRIPARKLVRSDKQQQGVENGNQPDRASAGGGGR